MKRNATKTALANALKQLLRQKQITKITINDITEACGISRMTFYYHFKDIYDLAEWTLEESAHLAIGENRDYDNWRQGFLNLLIGLKENQTLILNVYRSVDRELVEQYILRKVEALLMFVVEEQAADMQISSEGKHRVAVFYTYAFMGVVMEWFDKGMLTSPQEIVQVTAAILQGDFKNSLEHLALLEQNHPHP